MSQTAAHLVDHVFPTCPRIGSKLPAVNLPFVGVGLRCLCADRDYVQMPEVDGTGTESIGRCMPVLPAHSYSACRNRMSASGALNLFNLVSGGSSRARAFSFIARFAST